MKLNKTAAEDDAAKTLAELLLEQHKPVVCARALIVGRLLGSTSGIAAMLIHRTDDNYQDVLPHTHHDERLGNDTLFILRPVMQIVRHLHSTGATNIAHSMQHDEQAEALAFDDLSVIISVHKTYQFRTVIEVPGVPPCPMCVENKKRRLH